MIHDLPFCEASTGEFGACFNLDPWMLGLLCVVGAYHYMRAADGRSRLYAATGWLVVAAALVSPLGALSIVLFCAGVGQQLILILVAAPLLALASPPAPPRGLAIWTSAAIFLLTFWFWHMPYAYATTLGSAWAYWGMLATLTLSAVYLWRELLHHPHEFSRDALAAGALTFLHMALLGGLLTVAQRPLFSLQEAAAQEWAMTTLDDQRIGGALISAPALMLLAVMVARATLRLWSATPPARAGSRDEHAATAAADARESPMADDAACRKPGLI